MTDQVAVPKGLEEVVVAQSKLSYVYGREGRLIYRGYDIFDLAEHSTFEETAYLMLHGDVPGQLELTEFSRSLSENRALPQEVINRILRCLPAAGGAGCPGRHADPGRPSRRPAGIRESAP